MVLKFNSSELVQINSRMFKYFDSNLLRFQKKLNLEVLPESFRLRISSARRYKNNNNHSSSVAQIKGVYFLMNGIIEEDLAISQLYHLVKNDDKGREHQLKSYSANDPYDFFIKFENFLSHLVNRDSRRFNPKNKSVLRNIFLSFNHFAYLGIKLSMVNDAIKLGAFKVLNTFVKCTGEKNLERASRDNNLFTKFNSYRSEFLSMHADLQSSFSQRYDFVPEVISEIGLNPLFFIDQKSSVKPLKIKTKKTSKKSKKKSSSKRKSVPKKNSKRK